MGGRGCRDRSARRAIALLVVASAIPLFSTTFATANPSSPKHDEQEQEVWVPDEPCPSDDSTWLWIAGGAGGGGLVVVGLAAYGFRRGVFNGLRAALFWGLFARLSKRDVTEHPKRARLLELIRSRPGVSAHELSETSGLNPGTLDYHLAVLERAAEIRRIKSGRDRVYFAADYGQASRVAAAIHAPGRRDVVRLIEREPGLHAAAIATRLGLHRATILHHLRRLESEGLVRTERTSRVRCFPTDLLMGFLRRPSRTAMVLHEGQKNA